MKAGFFDDYAAEIKKRGLIGMYAQAAQDGKVLGTWARFGGDPSDSVSAFSGISRMESFSVTKSMVAVGAGIALEEGLIRLDERIADSFPEWTYDVTDPEILAITVEDLLKMASGMSVPYFFRDSPERREQKDWGRFIYQQKDYNLRRGQDFLYTNVNPYLIGCLIERKYGANLLEYLRYRVFEPLDIKNPDMTQCPMGHTIGSNGMEINIAELTRFGQMVLDGGVFNGKRIVSEEFLGAALSPQIHTRYKPDWPSESESLDYGYFFWVDSANRCAYMMGSFGQFCLILPEKNAVVSVLSLEYDSAAIGEVMWNTIVSKL